MSKTPNAEDVPFEVFHLGSDGSHTLFQGFCIGLGSSMEIVKGIAVPDKASSKKMMEFNACFSIVQWQSVSRSGFPDTVGKLQFLPRISIPSNEILLTLFVQDCTPSQQI